MFKTRYRTSHDTMEANAKAISILRKVRSGKVTSLLRESTDNVVKFIVNVKVVEKRVNKAVGRVMVVKVTAQYRRPEMTLAIIISKPPIDAGHVADVCPLEALLGTDDGDNPAIMLPSLAAGRLQEGPDG